MLQSASTATPMLERIVALLGDPSMRSLRALHNLPWELAHAIESTPLGARLHVLGLASVFLPRNSVRTLGGTGLNDVRALWLTDVFSLDHLGLLVVSPLWARLEEITLVPTKDLAGQTRTCVEWIAAHGRQLRRFRLIDECTYPPRWGGWCLALSPLDGGFALDARFETLSHGARFATLNLAIKLDALEPGTLRAIRIARTPAFPVRDDPYTARLRVACERHRPVVLELPS
ncbi:MAG TPA: hypothetical protein VFQ53_35630 [Kofleriaceae bacterium]|nr:hypothetical protein [Kofleriaceae bacterium]